MTAQGKASKALDKAFRAAFLVTGSSEVAEKAVLDGIAALECGYQLADDVLIVETVKSAIHRRDALVAPISRDCCVLRIPLGRRPAACSAVLHLTIREI